MAVPLGIEPRLPGPKPGVMTALIRVIRSTPTTASISITVGAPILGTLSIPLTANISTQAGAIIPAILSPRSTACMFIRAAPHIQEVPFLPTTAGMSIKEGATIPAASSTPPTPPFRLPCFMRSASDDAVGFSVFMQV